MNPSLAHTLKKFPFIRLLLALIAGICFQWYLPVQLIWWIAQGGVVLLLLLISERLSLSQKYSVRNLKGVLLLYLLFIVGAVLLYNKDIRNNKSWYGHSYSRSEWMAVALAEPLIKKPNSYKSEATVISVRSGEEWKKAVGKIIIYFKKDTDTTDLGHGSLIVIQKPVQAIVNSSNPGAFDYKRYCLFQGITGQVFLEDHSFQTLPSKMINPVENTLINIRRKTISVIKENISGKNEQGIAEALLIGYRNDLDKEIVQAYSNTGVVHIIAISGLHLGMIYGLLLLIFSKTASFKWMRWIKPVIILLVIWSFTLIAGAVPSILRSAVMFSFLVIGQNINRKTQSYNTLAASAFCVLVLDPFVLWSVGFLLSYAAVLGIITFLKSIANWFYFKNKILEKIWQLIAVTLSAQVFTLPIVIFYFHQFPNFFLLTNLIVVPVAGIILYGEILLLILSPLRDIAKWFGDVLESLIGTMNRFILFINDTPYSLWENLQINIFQTWLLLAVILSFIIWIKLNAGKSFLSFLVFLTLFSASLCYDLIVCNQQQKLIVYDIPKYSAIDLVQGSEYHFIGDNALKENGPLRNFHLQPSRIVSRYNHSTEKEVLKNKIFTFNEWKCLVLDTNCDFKSTSQAIALDILILSRNPEINIEKLAKIFSFQHLVVDSSVPNWKIEKWKKECEALHLPFYSVSRQGAFVLEYPAK